MDCNFSRQTRNNPRVTHANVAVRGMQYTLQKLTMVLKAGTAVEKDLQLMLLQPNHVSERGTAGTGFKRFVCTLYLERSLGTGFGRDACSAIISGGGDNKLIPHLSQPDQ